MDNRSRITLEEYSLIKSSILKEFDREVSKIVNISFFKEVDRLENIEGLKTSDLINVKEKCGMKLYAELFKIYSNYNSYARYTPICMNVIIQELSSNNELVGLFLNIAHEVGIIFSTDEQLIKRLIDTLKSGYSLITPNPSDDITSLITKQMLASLHINGSVLDKLFKDNFLYLVIVLIFSYFDESDFYRNYNECYKGKNK